MMLKYEMKKVFFKPSSWIAILLLFVLLGNACYLAAMHDLFYVNKQGEMEYGYQAMQKLKEAKKEWTGELTTKQLQKAIKKNRKNNQSKEARSNDINEQNTAYHKIQGMEDIRSMLNDSFGDFSKFDYYAADAVTPNQAGNFYKNRTSHLKKWLDTTASGQFTKQEKEYLIKKYERQKTPFFYDYADGWKQIFQYISMIVMIMTLILGFLTAGIFSNEFQLHADAIFFSTRYGRNKAVRSKIAAGFLITTVIYWVIVLIYSIILLGFFGADGAGCEIQTMEGNWKSIYPMVNIQKYFLIVIGGYIGSLFMICITMLVSAKTKSAVFAVLMPFVMIFLPSLIPSYFDQIPFLNQILGLFPDQLLQLDRVLNTFRLYQIGNHVVHSVPILFIVYLIATIVLCPILYGTYRKLGRAAGA